MCCVNNLTDNYSRGKTKSDFIMHWQIHWVGQLGLQNIHTCINKHSIAFVDYIHFCSTERLEVNVLLSDPLIYCVDNSPVNMYMRYVCK